MSTTQTEEAFEFRDAVHGFVKLTEAECAVVNCPTYQRLRDIRQLAMGHMVYPGANHTRFEHSLGCVHLASLVFDAVNRRQMQGRCPRFTAAFNAPDDGIERGRRLLRLAALLHDLGHAPFSHSGESLMPFRRTSGGRRRVNHEDMTAKLIRDTEIRDLIAANFGTAHFSVDEVVAVATSPEVSGVVDERTRAWYRFLNQILTGELGVDRMDYLLRDAHHSGQEAGKFDYRKLIDSMTIVPPPHETTDTFRLGLDGGGWLVAEQMVAARYLMYVALYFHKTKRAYERHLEQFMRAWLRKTFGSPFLPTSKPVAYAALTDSVVLGEIQRAGRNKRNPLHRLARPFADRSHMRLAKELVLADNFLIEDGRRVPDKERLDKLRKTVRLKFGNTVWVDECDHTAANFLGNTSSINVQLDGNTRQLAELSEVVRGMPSQIWRARFYASPEQKEEVKAACDNWLKLNPTGGR